MNRNYDQQLVNKMISPGASKQELEREKKKILLSLKDMLDYAHLVDGLGESFKDWREKTDKAKEILKSNGIKYGVE